MSLCLVMPHIFLVEFEYIAVIGLEDGRIVALTVFGKDAYRIV
jgi:hypothetical protein